MLTNKKFGFYAAALCLTGLLYSFLCAGLDRGQLQIIGSVITQEHGGWTAEQIRLPMTVGRFLSVPLAFVCCAAFLRGGVRQTLIPCAAGAALGCVGLAYANGLDVFGGAASGRYWLFFLSLTAIRCTGVLVQAALAVLCLQWFVRFRGRAMGVVTMGAPIFSAIGAAALANFVQTDLGGDYRPLYMGVAAALALLALSTGFLLRDRPEDAGLYPDGDGRAPDGEPEEEPPLTMGQLLRERRTWLTLLCLGALTASAVGCLDFLEPRLLVRGSGPTLLNRAAPWLALGTIFAIPASYVFGWLFDRLGPRWTVVLLALAEMSGAYLLWVFPKEVTAAVGVPLCLLLACLMGGAATVIPCVLGRVYGRRQLLSACRLLLPALLLVFALTEPMGALLGGGLRARLYPVLYCLAVLGLLTGLYLLPGKTRRGKKE